MKRIKYFAYSLLYKFNFWLQQEEDTLIQVEDKSTHIYCEAADHQLRLKLRNILMQCLNSF